MQETTTLHVEGAKVTVETSALFCAWFEKHIAKPVAAAPMLIPTPRMGEKYLCSVVTKKDGKLVVCHSFLLPDRSVKNWNDGMEWAKSLGADLLDRAEQAIAYRDMPDEFDKVVHWSNTHHDGDSSFAWYQGFDGGGQHGNDKNDEFAVRAVRREFSDLVI